MPRPKATTHPTALRGSMALGALATARLLHVLAAALALGGLASLPIVATRVHGAGDSRFATYGLAIATRIEHWLVWPASAGILVFGLGMVEGPIAAYSFTAEGNGWLHVGTTLWTLLALALYGLARARRELVAKAEQGATGGNPVRRLWQGWTAAWAIALLCVAGGVVAMQLKLGG
jgi:uncharacterized membrane protein